MSLWSRLYSVKRKYAPWWDKFDTAFAIALGGILLVGYATYVDPISPAGLLSGFKRFINQSGLLGLLTAFTAIIALYRLRHRPDEARPSVREDFDNYDGKEPTDFGLRNFGPGPALYLQAAVEVVDDDVEHVDSEYGPEPCLEVHDSPIHLQEGEFASLILEREDSWFEKVAEEFDIHRPEGPEDDEPDDSLMVNLHYTYVSQSGAREPTDVTAKRDDTDLLDNPDIIDRRDKPRQIELWRVVEAINSESSD